MPEEYELLPVSTIEELKKEVEELKKVKETAASAAELVDSIKELADYVDKLIVVDADLHSRITDLMIKITDLTKEMKVVSDLLRKGLGEPVSIEPKQVKSVAVQGVKPSNPVEEIRRLREENEKLLKQLSDLEKIYRERETKEMLRKALEKHYGGI